MIVCVTGGRRFADGKKIAAELKRLQMVARKPAEEMTLVHGDCHKGGADKLADAAARELGWRVIPVPVDSSQDGSWPAAGNKRNGRMLETWMPAIVLAFPDDQSRGTWDCVRRANALGIRVVIP